MIIATRYVIRQGDGATYQIRNLDAPLCPACGLLLSGYDRRARHVIGASGSVYWFSLRRFRCPKCKRLHIEIPDFMQARKHYEAAVIMEVIAGRPNMCPTDASTMRRWRLEKRPPGLPSAADEAAVSWEYIDEGEAVL